MLRSIALAVSLLLAGCAGGEEPDLGDNSVGGSVEVQSNETADVAAPEPEAAADTTGPAVVTVAGRSVPARAVVTGIESVDAACTLTLRTDDGGAEAINADRSVCDSDVIMNRRVQIDYQESDIMAASCDGDPDCLDTETVALAVVAEPID